MPERTHRKWNDVEYQLVYDYGDGLEVLCTEKTLESAKSTKQWYIHKKNIWPVICRRKIQQTGGDCNGLHGDRVQRL